MLVRKLIRDLLKSKWQYAAIVLMVLLGIAFFNASYAAYVNLAESYNASYRALDFEDFGITVNSAPDRVVDRIRRIPGVKAAEGRLVEDVTIELDRRNTKTLVGRLISIPVDREPRVNRIKLLSGKPLQSGRAREILLEASFAKFHHIGPGSMLTAVRGSGRVRLTVAGIVQSGEYLYVVRSKQEIMAMPDTFGVMFVSQEVLGSLVGKPDQISDIRVVLNGSRSPASVMRDCVSALAAYHPEAPVPRVDQPSYQMLQQDVQGFRSYAVLFPAFFLSVAGVAVYSLLLRMVHEQRPIIGLLRSLGLSRGAVVRHFLSIALVVGIAGSLLGTLLGVFMAEWVSKFYMSNLQVPVYDIEPRWEVLAGGIVIGLVTCLVGSAFPARAAAAIRPADAMRPVAPTYHRAWFNLDIPALPLLWRIPFRNVTRQPRRTISTLFGVVAGICLIMLARGLLDSTDVAIDELVHGSYRYDLRLDFIRNRTSADVSRVRSWPGVVSAEGLLEIPVDIQHGSRTYSAMLSGQETPSTLQFLKDDSGNIVRPGEESALFGQTLKNRLDLHIGDLVTLRIPEHFTKEQSTVRQLRVGGFTEEAIGTVVHVPRQTAYRLFRRDLELPPNAISGIAVKAAPKQLSEVRARLHQMPDAASVLSVPEIKGMIQGMMSTVRTFVAIMEIFGAMLAFAMIFNMVTINVLERTQEVATLRTLGVGRGAIARMVVLENLIVTLTGILIGLPTGRWFVGKFWEMAQTPEQQDLFTFNIFIRPSTFIYAGLTILITAFLSQLPALASLGRLNLAKSVKERSA